TRRRDPGVCPAGAARRRHQVLLLPGPRQDRSGAGQQHSGGRRHHPAVPRPQVVPIDIRSGNDVAMSSLPTDITAPGPPELSEVSAAIYAYIQPDGTWWINNTGFLTGPLGVISIDSCATRRRTQAYIDAIASVTPAPVRALINTHHHGDHTFGNCLFP